MLGGGGKKGPERFPEEGDTGRMVRAFLGEVVAWVTSGVFGYWQ